MTARQTAGATFDYDDIGDMTLDIGHWKHDTVYDTVNMTAR